MNQPKTEALEWLLSIQSQESADEAGYGSRLKQARAELAALKGGADNDEIIRIARRAIAMLPMAAGYIADRYAAKRVYVEHHADVMAAELAKALASPAPPTMYDQFVSEPARKALVEKEYAELQRGEAAAPSVDAAPSGTAISETANRMFPSLQMIKDAGFVPVAEISELKRLLRHVMRRGVGRTTCQFPCADCVAARKAAGV